MKWATKKDTKVDDILITDGGFTCLPKNAHLTVKEDKDGLYILCRAGKHYLDGQLDDKGNYVGLIHKEKSK